MNTISLLLPTRGRPKLVERFFQSLKDTVSNLSNVEVILYIDEDDIESHNLGSSDIQITIIIGPRLTMGGYNAACYQKANGDIIVLVNDDIVFVTESWDKRLIDFDASIKDKIYLAYPNDLFKGKKLCAFPILSRYTCEILQEPFHKAYRGAFIDYHLMDIFKRLKHTGYPRIFYLDDLVFEHLHYRTGKAEKDTTYTERGRFDDDMIFLCLAPVRKVLVQLLINAIIGNDNTVSLPNSEVVSPPANLWQALQLFTRTFLLDNSIPPGWRFFLWWWFSARFIVQKVLHKA